MPATRTRAVVIAALILSATPVALADVIYVDEAQTTGANDGSSWDDAYEGMLGLQNALGRSVAGDDIWVAAGTYLPAISGPRTASFSLGAGVRIYGGFAGGETAVEDRDFTTNVVTLSGDLAQNDEGGSIAENAYHVLVSGTSDDATLLSGVTVTGGFANATGNDRGAGIEILGGDSPRIEDCVFVTNRCTFGGGACYIANASPSFTRVRFEDNIGGSFGGAFDIFSSGGNSAVEFTDCRFIGNSAVRAGGVELFGSNTSATLQNCLFFDNSCTGQGGGMWIGNGASSVIRNTTVVANSSTGNTGGIHLSGATATVGNSIVWFNTDPDGNDEQVFGSANLTLTNIEGGWTGGGALNLDAEPFFVDLTAGDLRLDDGSPGIDAGSNALVPMGVLTDLDGNPRLFDDECVEDTGFGARPPIVDLGALERVEPCATSCDGDVDGDGVVDTDDLLQIIGAWGPCDGCDEDINGDGMVGVDDLLVVIGAWGDCP